MKANNKDIAVLGGGSFGTVIANIAASNGNKVSLWVRDSEQALRINSEGANTCLLYTSPSPRDLSTSRMPSSA